MAPSSITRLFPARPVDSIQGPVMSQQSTTAPLEAQPGPFLVDLSPRATGERWGAAWQSWGGGARRVASPLALLLLWQLAVELAIVPRQVLPAPSQIVAAFGELIDTGELQRALPASIGRSLLGLAIGGSIGLAIGLFAGLWRIGEEIFDAPLQMLRTVPFIAAVPLFIIWFGIDEPVKIIVILAATVFPVYLNTYAGVRGVDPKLIEAATIFGLSHIRIIRHVILPTAMPSILVGIRYAAGISLLALVVAEQINARAGIGYILTNANTNQRSDIIIAGIIVYAALGILTDIIMRRVESAVLPWKPQHAVV
jgi:sulfonate transport system permease protein